MRETIQHRYRDIVREDLVEPVRRMIGKQGFRIRDDGRIEIELRQSAETPWLHVRQDPQRKCALWNHVWFECYGFIPSYCQDCWKVVVRPTSLTELFMLAEIMTGLDMTSKCGTEKRYSVPALYGAYFYNTSKEEGLACSKLVENIVYREMGSHVKVFLKRACTEFEHKHGDSRQWTVTEEQRNLERRLEDLFVLSSAAVHNQSDEMRRHVMANWVRFAYAQGDPSARDFMSTPLYPPYVTYDRETCGYE